MLPVIAAAVANSVPLSPGCAKNDFLDTPTIIGSSSRANSPRRAKISEFCSRRFPNPIPGSTMIRIRSTPARRARFTEASRSFTIDPITSGSGASVAHVWGFPRIWLKITPAL